MFIMLLALLGAAEEGKPMYDLVKEGKAASLSTDYKGTPFGSVTPYALDSNGSPVIYLSDLAVHTKNLKKNSACSLMVVKVDEDDVFNTARITFVGKMVLVPEGEVKEVKKVFFDRHEGAKAFEELGDFSFYRMEIEKIYYIGGFGDINWIDPEDYRKGFKQ